jgi:hypothetical protein
MTINKKGGKHKHFKRDTTIKDAAKNPNNINKASILNNEFYATINKSLGNKRYEIKVIDSLWKNTKIIFNAVLKGSKKMKKFYSLLTNGNQNNRLVKISYDDTINFIEIIHVYHEWEIDFLKDELDDDNNVRILFNKSDNLNNEFSYDFAEANIQSKVKKSNSISIEELTGVASSDDDDDNPNKIPHNFAALNKPITKPKKKYENINESDEIDFDSI